MSFTRGFHSEFQGGPKTPARVMCRNSPCHDRHSQSVSVEAVHCNHPIRAGDPMVWPKIIKNRSPLILFDTLCVLKIAIATGFLKKKNAIDQKVSRPPVSMLLTIASPWLEQGTRLLIHIRTVATKPSRPRNAFLILKRLYSSPPKRENSWKPGKK